MITREVTSFCKGIAIIFVILCHSHQTFNLPLSLNAVFSFFQVGVQLFMLLSAMGLCFSYDKSPVSWLTFFKKRLAKLTIPYWFAIILASFYRVLRAYISQNSILKELNPFGIFVNTFFLHGFSSDNVINNQIVRGGWFVGTIIILYALFPYIYRLYFSKNEQWKKIRKIIFPLISFIISIVAVFSFKRFLPDHALSNLFLQFPTFALGFPLFELQKNNNVKSVKYPLIKFGVFAILAIVTYFSSTAFNFFYVFSIGFSFFYGIIYILKSKRLSEAINGNSLFCRLLKNWGKYSFSIYLTQSYIAFDFCYLANAVLSRIYSNDLLWFIVLQPFVFTVAYYVGKLFEIISNFINSKLLK